MDAPLISTLCMAPQCPSVLDCTFKGVRKKYLKYKVSFDWEIRISDFGIERESENGFHLREIRLQGGFQWNPNPDFVDLLFTVRLRNGFARLFSWTVVFFLLIKRARARPLFIKTVFQILFRIFQSNVKNETLKTDISALKSVFGFRVRLQIRNPVFKSKSRFLNRTHPKKKRCLLRCAHARDIKWKWNNIRRYKLERNVTRNKPKQRMQYLLPRNQLIRQLVALCMYVFCYLLSWNVL